ncbi:MAG TPA: hypothetical protein VF816_02795 [Rhodocyclaceae bacterium]
MEKFSASWLWFALAIGALAAAVAAQGMAALFYVLALALIIVGIVFLVKQRR